MGHSLHPAMSDTPPFTFRRDSEPSPLKLSKAKIGLAHTTSAPRPSDSRPLKERRRSALTGRYWRRASLPSSHSKSSFEQRHDALWALAQEKQNRKTFHTPIRGPKGPAYPLDQLALVVASITSFFTAVFLEIATSTRLVLVALAALLAYIGRDTIFTWMVNQHRYYNKQMRIRNMPKRIILIRHGQSMGNIDDSIYSRVADNQVELTELGKQQALNAGQEIREIVGDETVRFFVSPYTRSTQTFEGIIAGGQFDPTTYTVREEPRIREQDWGNFQQYEQIQKCRQERRKFGSFYYRFPHGESGSDVYDRVDSFWGSIQREFAFKHCLENFVLVSHGITCRLILMRYFKWTVRDFHKLWNFTNCQIAVLEKDSNGKYRLTTPLRRN